MLAVSSVFAYLNWLNESVLLWLTACERESGSMTGPVMGVIAGIILPLIGVWVTLSSLSAAARLSDEDAEG